ncbi:hypothetical protein D3C75_774930 [compost metagenome]
MSVEAVHVRMAVVTAGTAARPTGAVGGVLSLLSKVFTVTVLLAAEILPAASTALTVKVYVVLAFSPLIV